MIEKRLPLKNRLPFLMCLGMALLSLILFLLITDVLSERNGNAELMSRIAEFMPQAGMPGYEHFDLSKEDAKLLDKAIERWLKEPHYSPEDLTKIYVLLYIKHDTMPHDYISEAQRQIFIQKISQAAPENFDDKARQIRLLKYGLGINNISELKNPTNICERDNLFLDDFNWETLKGIDRP
jgi:hypothetical protein